MGMTAKTLWPASTRFLRELSTRMVLYKVYKVLITLAFGYCCSPPPCSLIRSCSHYQRSPEDSQGSGNFLYCRLLSSCKAVLSNQDCVLISGFTAYSVMHYSSASLALSEEWKETGRRAVSHAQRACFGASVLGASVSRIPLPATSGENQTGVITKVNNHLLQSF